MMKTIAILAALVVTANAKLTRPSWLHWPWICPIPLCLDPCWECNLTYGSTQGQCITETSFFYHNGMRCPGCQVLVSCGEPGCCELADKPTEVECGRSGCTCCGGEWITGNSGPTLKPEEVCRPLGLEVTKPCESMDCCDPKDKPTDVQCGRSGCTCCGGEWITGNSGPTLEPKEVCGRLGLEVTKPCEPSQGPVCGSQICGAGEECCNASCGICVAPGMSCTQQACDDKY